jgi:stage II sporulation protein D
MAMMTASILIPVAHAATPVRTRVLEVRPNPDVIVRGSGWGHSVGMSQYGAFAQARAGWGYGRILRHYYPGIEIPKAPMPSRIRVGLSSTLTFSNVDALNGPIPWKVCAEDGDCQTRVTQRKGTTFTVDVLSDGRFRLRRGDVVKFRGGQGKTLVAAFNPTATTSGTTIEAYNPNVGRALYRWGRLEYTVNSRSARSMFVVMNVPSVELYLRGLGEMPASWGEAGGMAALRAQVVAARTYAVRLHKRYGGFASTCRCSLVATPANQVYTGYTKETGAYAENWVQAVKDTVGHVATYNGGLIEAFYSSSHGGRSEAVEDSYAFGTTPYPYLKSVEDHWSVDAPGNPYARWEHTITNDRFASFVGGGIRKVRRVAIRGRTDGGSPRTLSVEGLGADRRPLTVTRASKIEQIDSRYTNKGIVGADLKLAFAYPGLTALPSQQVRTIGFAPFTDEDGTRNEYPIVFVARAGIMNGATPDTFVPASFVSRAGVALVLVRTFRVAPAPDGKDYYDDDDGLPTEDAINALAHAGITGGLKAREFSPNAEVTRGTLAALLKGLGAPAVPRLYFDGTGSRRVRRGALARVLLTVVERAR